MPHSRGRGKTRTCHSKSRGGCFTCRKRHIKCDQKRPECTNCTTRELHCPFADNVGGATTPSTTHVQPSPQTSGLNSTNASLPSSLQHGATDVSIMHLELYNHFVFNLCPTFSGQPRHDEAYRDLITKIAFKHHFVLYELLGLAALSKHLFSPNDTYKALATSFQEKAIAGLDDILTKIDSENCVAVVLFAHLIGSHSFCDTFSSAQYKTFHDFLEALIHSANMLRGIHSIVRPFWVDLASTVVGEFMRDAETRRDQMGSRSGNETASLHSLTQNADISDSSRETYEDSIVRLQRDFDELHALDAKQRATTHTAFTWLIASSPAYLQLLGDARPEALVILAYYAVVLHRRRGCWAIGSAGYTLLESVMSHLGRPWKQWLMWPRSQIGNDYHDILNESPGT